MLKNAYGTLPSLQHTSQLSSTFSLNFHLNIFSPICLTILYLVPIKILYKNITYFYKQHWEQLLFSFSLISFFHFLINFYFVLIFCFFTFKLRLNCFFFKCYLLFILKEPFLWVFTNLTRLNPVYLLFYSFNMLKKS